MMQAPEEQVSKEDALKSYQSSVLSRLELVAKSELASIQGQAERLKQVQSEVMREMDEARSIHMRIREKLEANMLADNDQTGCISVQVKDKILSSFQPKIDQVVQALYEQSESFDRKIAKIESSYQSAKQDAMNQIYCMDVKVEQLFTQLLLKNQSSQGQDQNSCPRSEYGESLQNSFSNEAC